MFYPEDLLFETISRHLCQQDTKNVTIPLHPYCTGVEKKQKPGCICVAVAVHVACLCSQIPALQRFPAECFEGRSCKEEEGEATEVLILELLKSQPRLFSSSTWENTCHGH